MNMVPVEGSEQKLDADLVLIAAGFLGTEKYVADAFGVKLNARTNVETEEGCYKTNVKKSLPQVICTEASHWLYGRSAKAVRQPEKWMRA